MFLLEALTIVACVVMLGVDIRLGIKCYEKYVVLPRLLSERKAVMDAAYASAKDAEARRRKAVNDKIRRSPKNVVKFPARKNNVRKAA